jgi:hypothetical protein
MVQEKQPLFYAVVCHICSVKELMVPMIFVIVLEVLVISLLALTLFHRICNTNPFDPLEGEMSS